MRGREMLDTIENLNPAYIEAAAEKPKAKKVGWLKWGAMAACLCLVLGGGILLNTLRPTDFHSMVTGGSVNNTLTITTLNIDDYLACYAQLDIDSSKLERYVGEQNL